MNASKKDIINNILDRGKWADKIKNMSNGEDFVDSNGKNLVV